MSKSLVATRWHNRAREQLSVLMLGEQADAKEGKVMVDHEPDVDYEPKGPDPSNERVNKEEEKKDFNAEFPYLELPP